MEGTGLTFDEVDYAKRALTADQVRGIVAAAGSVAAVLNARHERAKAGGWKERPPEPEVFVMAALAEPNLLRRPILVAGPEGARAVVVGNQPEEMARLLRG